VNDDEFEWDDTKAAKNFADHGVTFEFSLKVFQDPLALEWLDTTEDYGEERYVIVGMAESRLLFVVYTQRDGRTRLISARSAEPMSGSDTTRKVAKHDWARFDAMTSEERHAAALHDPDAQPMTAEREKRMRRTAQVFVIRRALKLSQEDFAEKFQIPLGTLRDWEQGRKEPDAAARAYLKVIARNPTAVADALQPA
jgi:putative transcriptional regulator